MDKFDEFKKKEKFFEDPPIFYTGIGDPVMRPFLAEKMDQAADDFKEVSMTANTRDIDYREKIKIGLDRFRDIDLDTEDKERICHYFEELMDIVGLQSSDGLLNEFLYSFDPNKFKK